MQYPDNTSLKAFVIFQQILEFPRKSWNEQVFRGC